MPEREETWEGNEATFDDPEEKRVLFAALDSFYQYAKVAHYNTTHLRRQSFYALPRAHWELLAAPPFSYLDTLNAVDDAIDENAVLAQAIWKSGLESFGLPLRPPEPKGNGKHPQDWRGFASASDLDKARSTLRQFYRDWSTEGRAERVACYDPVIRDLQEEQSLHSSPESISVLVPGAGLGRLVFELCRNGFNVEGNEISYHQLLASSYILNSSPGPCAHKLYPWIHTFSNHGSRSQHLQSVQVPDIHPGTTLAGDRGSGSTILHKSGGMSMSASDFLCLYGDIDHINTYDAVATVFFLDTAPNPIRYIETVRNCLKTGGIWVNLGPLLWHFENNAPGSHGKSGDNTNTENDMNGGIADPGSVELSNDEVALLVEKYGFTFERMEFGHIAGYIQDPSSMIQNMYRVSHWVARKL